MTETKSGILILNKPAEISSNAVVNKVKYLLKAKKAGHLGTLDVLGEGVLPVTLNKATKLFDYFLKKDKTYHATFIFGIETSTLDCEGEITNINYRLVSRFEIEKALEKFKGKIQQLPPQFSALKINGRTAYEAARKGEFVDLKPREVEIYDLQLLKEVDEKEKQKLTDRFLKFHNIDLLKDEDVKNSFTNNIFEFEITCSSGTYIRSLCKDIAKALTSCGAMLSIVRTRCGNFDLKNAVSIEDVKNGKFDIIDVEKIIDLSSVYLTKQEGIDILNGKKVEYKLVEKTAFKLYCDNEFYGIANNKNNGIIKIETYLKD